MKHETITLRAKVIYKLYWNSTGMTALQRSRGRGTKNNQASKQQADYVTSVTVESRISGPRVVT
jgi:hypothetical protein